MTRDEACGSGMRCSKREALLWVPLLEAFAAGKQIQRADYGRDNWHDIEGFEAYIRPECYRIKPEPKIRPWTEAERRQHLINATVIQIADKIGPLSEQCGVPNICGLCFSWEALFEHGKIYATGAPCGVLE